MLSIFLCGCSRTYNWKFKNESSEVIQVSVIDIEIAIPSKSDKAPKLYTLMKNTDNPIVII